MPTLPLLDAQHNACHSPHVILLGAGASRAALPDGDRLGRHLPLMNDFVAVVGLGDLLADAGVPPPAGNFEEIYQGIVENPALTDIAGEIEARIYDYFSDLRLPDRVTLYDELILSLRDKDLIATFNWDPFLLQAYRRNLDIRRLPRVVFLHGNVAVGSCAVDQTKGFAWQSCMKCGKPFPRTKLLYPIRQKNYTQDPFINNEWTELRHFLEHAYLLTIVGYSAPASDVEAKQLLEDVWLANQTRELAEISIVDIRPEAELERTWSSFFVRNHYGISPELDRLLLSHPRRSCDAFAMASLQQRPCKDNRLPRFTELTDLQAWIRPLVAEEDALEERGTPFEC